MGRVQSEIIGGLREAYGHASGTKKNIYSNSSKACERRFESISISGNGTGGKLDEGKPATSPAESTEIGMQQYAQLNDTQKIFVDAVLSAIENDNAEQTCFYIDGPGGSGKIFTYTTLSHLVRGRGKCVSAMAFPGISAILLPEGKTVHKTFGLPVPLYSDSSSNIKVQSNQGEYLKNVDFFIWDEAPMAPRYALEVADRTLRDMMNNNKPFGGKVIVLGGDFRQLLSVKVRGTRTETVSLSIKYSELWRHF